MNKHQNYAVDFCLAHWGYFAGVDKSGPGLSRSGTYSRFNDRSPLPLVPDLTVDEYHKLLFNIMGNIYGYNHLLHKVLRLHYQDDLSIKQIGEVLMFSYRTANARFNEGRIAFMWQMYGTPLEVMLVSYAKETQQPTDNAYAVVI